MPSVITLGMMSQHPTNAKIYLKITGVKK